MNSKNFKPQLHLFHSVAAGVIPFNFSHFGFCTFYIAGNIIGTKPIARKTKFLFIACLMPVDMHSDLNQVFLPKENLLLGQHLGISK